MAAVVLPFFNWREPNYVPVIAARVERLRRLGADPSTVPAVRLYYRDHITRFIDDWGITADPRNALLSPPRAVVVPFVLFPKQIEWVEWVLERARNREPGLCEKSRDCGVSWLSMATAVSLCLFNRNLTIGFGSQKEDKLDRSGDPDCLFFKGRTFLRSLPVEFRGGWDEARNSAHLRLAFPETGSAIVGEAGENIGRGGRQSITFLDEAAHIEHSELVDASLASTTDCRIDMSSVNGMNNSFARRRHSGKISVFTFHWRDDPRKGDAWYAKQKRDLDPVTLAAEVDIDYRASERGMLIPSAWIQSAVDAHIKLGIIPSGMRRGAVDIADEGIDLNAFAGRHGILLEALRSWSGKNRDIFDSVVRAFSMCDEMRYDTLLYDADGMGAGVRGDARVINEDRTAAELRTIGDEPFRGSASPEDPEGEMVEGRTNADFFANLKAQSWWSLRMRFQATHRAVVEGKEFDPDALISLGADLEERPQLMHELSQPTYSINTAGKIVIDKTPPGTRSPNLADAVMMCFSPVLGLLEVWRKL